MASIVDMRGKLLPNSTDPIYDSLYPNGNRSSGGGGSGTPMWTQNFDTATTNASLLTLGFGDTDAIVSTEQFFSGTKSAKHTMTGGSDNALSFGLMRPLESNTKLYLGDEFWVQAQFFYPIGWDFGNSGNANLGGTAPRIKHFRLQTFHADNSNAGYNDIYLYKQDANSTRWQFIYEGVQQWAFDGIDGYAPSRPQAPYTGIVRGEWRKIEYYVKLHNNPSQARVRMWENNAPVFEINDLATLTSATDYANIFRFCTYVNGGAPQTQSMWTDDWKIYTSTTGIPTATDSLGNKYIG